jgi:hypothetical protein
MTQLSLRGFDKQLEQQLKELARREGVSLNQAALMLLKKGAGLDDATASPRTAIGDGLDRFIGRWSRAEEEEFLESIAACEAVDEAFWK